MVITFRNHPAQARHPITGSGLEDEDGEPVPMFPQLRSIYLDGVMCGYCDQDGGPVTLTVHLPVEILQQIRERVKDEFAEPCSVNMPPVAPDNPLGDVEDE